MGKKISESCFCLQTLLKCQCCNTGIFSHALLTKCFSPAKPFIYKSVSHSGTSFPCCAPVSRVSFPFIPEPRRAFLWGVGLVGEASWWTESLSPLEDGRISLGEEHGQVEMQAQGLGGRECVGGGEDTGAMRLSLVLGLCPVRDQLLCLDLLGPWGLLISLDFASP